MDVDGCGSSGYLCRTGPIGRRNCLEWFLNSLGNQEVWSFRFLRTNVERSRRYGETVLRGLHEAGRKGRDRGARKNQNRGRCSITSRCCCSCCQEANEEKRENKQPHRTNLAFVCRPLFSSYPVPGFGLVYHWAPAGLQCVRCCQPGGDGRLGGVGRTRISATLLSDPLRPLLLPPLSPQQQSPSGPLLSLADFYLIYTMCKRHLMDEAAAATTGGGGRRRRRQRRRRPRRREWFVLTRHVPPASSHQPIHVVIGTKGGQSVSPSGRQAGRQHQW